MPSQTSSLRAYGLRAHTGRTACSVAAILAACSVSASPAAADHTASYEGVLSAKKVDGEKPGKGIGRGRGGKVPEPTAPLLEPVPTVAAPTPTVTTPAPTPTQPPAPTPTQEAPRQQAPRPKATPEAHRPTPATPAAPVVTPDRSPSPDPTPTREPDEDRAAIGAAPGPGGPAPGAATPDAPRGASPGPAPARRRIQAPRPTGGLVDLGDRAAGGGSTPGSSGGSRRGGGSTGSAPVAYREDSTGRRVYSVPSADGTRRRTVSVPGGVFGALPSAAIEATAEVAGAREAGRTRSGSASESDVAAPTGVTATLSRPLQAIDEMTGASVSPLLVAGALAAVAVALGFGIRRELHRW